MIFMQCALTQIPALNVLVRVGILVMDAFAQVRSALVCTFILCIEEFKVLHGRSIIIVTLTKYDMLTPRHLSTMFCIHLARTASGTVYFQKYYFSVYSRTFILRT